MFKSNMWDTNSRRFLHLIIKRSTLTKSMNRELLRTILGLFWWIISLDLIQGKYPVIKPSVLALDLSNALLGRGNMILWQGKGHKWLKSYSWEWCSRHLGTQSCMTSHDYDSINYLWNRPFLVAFVRQQKSGTASQRLGSLRVTIGHNLVKIRS
jgi:hypothetical protein